ncbi:MAG: Do family serine endopeptidase [Bacteroidetes bacterium]|nr:Do family serine endopeptidase [Bacteroidota bacterium]
MKKVLSTLLIAAVGGGAALFMQQKLVKQTDAIAQQEAQAIPVHFASSSGAVASAAPDFTGAAETSVNTVVHIKTQTQAKYEDQMYYNPFQQFFYGNSQPQQRIQQGSGSGVIIDKNGYIVTNNHVINGADKIEVILNDKRSYPAELVGADPQTDLALLKINEKNLPFLPYGNSDNVKVGEWCLAIGNPFNLTSTITAGIISAKGRNINILENDPSRGIFPIESFIQTDAAVNPGNSGGALVNTNGDLIGINSAIASQNGAYIGYSFAIPVNMVKKVVADLAEFGTVQRAYIGVSIRDIDSKLAEEKSIKDLNGVYVNGLTENGAAEKAGVQIGDVVTKIEGFNVNNTSSLQEQISKYRPGNKIEVTLLRGNKEIKVPVILKNKDGNTDILKKEAVTKAKEVTTISALGANFEVLDPSDMKKLNIQNGVRVTNLQNGKLYAAGIREGFIITAIDKKKIHNIDELNQILKSKQGGTLIEGIYPNGMRAYYGFGM